MARNNNNPDNKDNLIIPNFSESHFEASNLLKNGILVETSKGLVCLSLNDALASNLNVTAEELQQVATQLIFQENKQLENSEFSGQLNSDFYSTDTTADSDEPTSESSDNFAEKPEIIEIRKEEFLNLQTFGSFDVIASTSSDSEVNNKETGKNISKSEIKNDTGEPVKIPAKRKGGWPKGRKRKPEVLHLPPKAPATGYTLYLNEKRKLFKNSSLAFYEITKILGNKWSSLSLEEKQPYLDRAEEEKKRYREELRTYRQSGAYQLYLAKKRKKKVQNNIMSESDMDATDDFDDEDNEELYCRTCDQWFHSLHNKKEHLQGRQHLQTIAGHIRKLENQHEQISDLNCHLEVKDSANTCTDTSDDSLTDVMANLLSIIAKHNVELQILKKKITEKKRNDLTFSQQLNGLQFQEKSLKNELSEEKGKQKDLETEIWCLLGMKS